MCMAVSRETSGKDVRSTRLANLHHLEVNQGTPREVVRSSVNVLTADGACVSLLSQKATLLNSARKYLPPH